MRLVPFIKTACFVILTASLFSGCGRSYKDAVLVTSTTTASTPENTYLVEYIPGTMDAASGKTIFQLHVRKRADSTDAAGLTITLDPVMHMSSGMVHATPVDTIEDLGSGIYECTVYYLMSDHMMGSPVGYWELDVNIGSETATFYPSVGMGMREIQKVYGPDDSMMDPANPNKYYLFNDSAADNSIALFISHGEEMMMKFVSASQGAVMASPTGAVNAMTVELSVDDETFASPFSAANLAAGHWVATGLNKSVGGANKVYVRVTVNTQDKTQNGLAWDGAANSAAAFNIMIPGI